MNEKYGEGNGENNNKEALINELKITKFLLPLILGSGGEAFREDELKRKAFSLGIITDGSFLCYRIVVISFETNSKQSLPTDDDAAFINEKLLTKYNAFSFCVGGKIASVIFHNGETKEKLRAFLKDVEKSCLTHLNKHSAVGVSRDSYRLSLCSTAYYEAVTAVRQNNKALGEVLFISDAASNDNEEAAARNVEKTVIELESLLKSGSTENLLGFLDTLYNDTNKQTLDYIVIQILAAVCKTVSAVSGGADVSNFFGLNPVLLKAAYYANGDGIKDDLRRLCLDAREIISHYQKHDSELICENVVNIINSEYYDENLSLTSIGARLNISPNYLSALIKKTMNKNFITLLTERRMSAAYDLLTLSTAKIGKISEECGYSDQHYFAYCFKKYYGVSPSKIRQGFKTQANDD